jgi:hypothetical protein
MLCKMLRQANPVRFRNLPFTSAVICLALFMSACAQATTDTSSGATREPSRANRSQSGETHAWSIELRYAEHKTVKHPEKKIYATIWPDGIQVTFTTADGRFTPYTWEHEQFPVREPVFLSCHASLDLLPMRVARLKEVGDYVDYEIEWLAELPTKSDGARKVARCR